MGYVNMHIVFIGVFCMLKLNIGIYIYNEPQVGISNEF
ncbi:serine kinase (plasmid) [Bacillus mycoides]|nr:serine kinase [Bacillus mycoides]